MTITLLSGKRAVSRRGSDNSCHLKEDENSGVAWFFLDEAMEKSSEKWFVDNIYSKLIRKMKSI